MHRSMPTLSGSETQDESTVENNQNGTVLISDNMEGVKKVYH